MTELLLLGLAWLVMTMPFAIFMGKCISVGQAGPTARHVAAASTLETTLVFQAPDGVSEEGQSESMAADTSALPEQRQAAHPAHEVGWGVSAEVRL